MSGPPDLTVTRIRPFTPTAASLHVTTDRAFADAVRSLLHYRLKICCWSCLVCGIGLLLLGIGFRSNASGHGAGLAFGHGLNATIILIFAAILILLRPQFLSLQRLRLLELAIFGALTAYAAVSRYVAFAHLPLDPSEGELTRIRIEHQAGVANYVWYFVIMYYGILIPNTRQRGLAVVAAIVAVDFLVTILAAEANPPLQPHLPLQLSIFSIGLFMSGVAAVFSAARINTLQRQSFEAERRADELGQYTLKKKLGAGGMGEVWLAEHRLLKRPCAVKFIRADLAVNPAAAARFAREVQAVTGLTHFNTVRVYDYGQSDDGSFYYVMEHLDGPTLEALVKRHGPLAPDRTVRLLRQLCGALAEAHTTGLVHRDIKPANVIVATLGGQPDVAKLLDFGLVQDLSLIGSEGRLTQTGVVMGTPAYICPEQASGVDRVDARGDLYALGAVAFFCLTGRPPFERDTVGGYLAAHLTEPAPAVTAVNPDLPTDLTAIVAKCLAKDPVARFQSATDLDAALAACRCPTASPPRAPASPLAPSTAGATETFCTPEAPR